MADKSLRCISFLSPPPGAFTLAFDEALHATLVHEDHPVAVGEVGSERPAIGPSPDWPVVGFGMRDPVAALLEGVQQRVLFDLKERGRLAELRFALGARVSPKPAAWSPARPIQSTAASRVALGAFDRGPRRIRAVLRSLPLRVKDAGIFAGR